ncbi:MAG: hypothetical protein ACFB8W_10950 [Elainellaceae cyanobacterium]
MNLEQATQTLASVRREGKPEEITDALVEYANTLIESGRIAEACVAMDEAAQLHHELQQFIDEARCSHLAASLYRFIGELPNAQKRAEYALKLVEAGTPIAVSAAAELGEIAFSTGKMQLAANYYLEALKHGEIAGLLPRLQAELLRKRAYALSQVQNLDDAIQSLQHALSLVQQPENADLAVRIQIEQATALQLLGNWEDAEEIVKKAQRQAFSLNDGLALADLCLLQSTYCLETGSIASARVIAEMARGYALQASAPVQYVGAAIAISDFANAQQDWIGAYEALAVGWVTLSDLMGAEVGEASFKPKLLELRERWGIEKFNSIKTAYESRRRALMCQQQ